MIPAEVLTLAAAVDVTLSVAATPAGYDATATYVYSGVELSPVVRNAASSRDAVAAALAGLSSQCREHIAACEKRGVVDAGRNWRWRWRRLRDLRRDVLALWTFAPEVAS